MEIWENLNFFIIHALPKNFQRDFFLGGNHPNRYALRNQNIFIQVVSIAPISLQHLRLCHMALV